MSATPYSNVCVLKFDFSVLHSRQTERVSLLYIDNLILRTCLLQMVFR